jgi:hypothetical protein
LLIQPGYVGHNLELARKFSSAGHGMGEAAIIQSRVTRVEALERFAGME